MKKIIYILTGIIGCAALLAGCTPRLNGTGVLGESTSATVTESTAVTDTTSTTSPTAKAVAGSEDLSAEKVVWGPGRAENHAVPDEPKTLQEKYASLGAKWLLEDEGKVLLTFDEGYENGFTPQILDTLKEKNVKAVFFVTYDFARDNGELVQRMIDEGHIVGNHSYHHYSMDELDTETAKEEVTFLHEYIKENFNYEMKYFRFPKGEFSEKTLGILRELGYESIFWSFAYADWDVNEQPEATAAFTGICEHTHPGAILLLHAVSQTNADILGKVIDDVRQQGYAFAEKI